MLDVSNNKLYGKVPNFQQNKIVLKTEGNPDIRKEKLADGPFGSGASSGGEAATSGKKSTTRVSIGSVVGVFCVLAIVVLGLCLYSKRRKHSGKVQSLHAMVIHPRHSDDNDAVKITINGSLVNGVRTETHSQASNGPNDLSMIEAGTMIISIQVSRTVTDYFSEENMLGRDRFGTVYKGELHDGTTIVVNRMGPSIITNKCLTEFKSKIVVLTRVMHHHLVALLDYCLDGNGRLLVYENIPHEGEDMEHDSACKSVKEMQSILIKHLKEQGELLEKTSITYVIVEKESYLSEIPKNSSGSVLQDDELSSSTKEFFRYLTHTIKKGCSESSQTQKQKGVSSKNSVCITRCLISPAIANDSYEGPTCRPTIVRSSSNEVPCFVRSDGYSYGVVSSWAVI
ncbi:hypothetical protein ACFE04_000112 [Oxalis oulophora]